MSPPFLQVLFLLMISTMRYLVALGQEISQLT